MWVILHHRQNLTYVFVPDLNILIFNIEMLFEKLCIAKFSVLLSLFSYLFLAHSAPHERKLIENKHLIINDLLEKYQIKCMEFMFISLMIEIIIFHG